MVACIIVLSIGLIATGVFTFDKLRGYGIRETIIKSFASICFVLLGVLANHINGLSYFGSFAIGALALGLMGDIFLELKYVYPKDDDILTYSGFACFGLGHVLYISGMISSFYQKGHAINLIIPFVVGLAFSGFIILLEKPMKLKYGKMKIVSSVYAFFLFSMVAMSFSLYILSGFKAVTLLMVSIGAALFAISDLVLSGTYFGQGHDKPLDLVSNVWMYYLAQNLIAFSIYFVGVSF